VSTNDELPRGQLRVMQIIAGAMLTGVLGMLAFVLYFVLVVRNGQAVNPRAEIPLLSLLAVILLAANVPVAIVLPGNLTRAAVRQIAAGTWRPAGFTGLSPNTLNTDSAKLLAVRQTTKIIALALVEGAACLGGMAYLLEAKPWALGVVAVAILFILFTFPTEGRVRTWLEQQTGRLAEARQPGGF
jgi:hypothetical protein